MEISIMATANFVTLAGTLPRMTQDQKIVVNAIVNPFRVGSMQHTVLNMFKTGQTVQQALEIGAVPKFIRWARNRELIALV
jgi:hypothetical protein